MHITHIIPTLSFGGAEKTVIDIINLSDPNLRFSIIVFFPVTPLQSQISRPNVEVIYLPKKGKLSFGLLSGIKTVLKNLQTDVVHTHLFSPDVWGRLAAHSLGIPVVSTEHNILDNDGFFKSVIKRCVKNLSTISVACSQKVKEHMIQHYGLGDSIEVVLPGVELEKFVSLPLPSFSSPIKFLIIGRLSEQKGHEIGLRALAQVSGNWELSIVGDGHLEAYLKKLCKELNIADKVKFFPATHDVGPIYGSHDIVLMPSKWEGLSLVAMETLAAGRPLLVSNVGGMSEIIEDGENGFLLDPTVSAFSKKIQWCLDNPKELLSLCGSAREFAKENCGVKRMVSQYTEIYKRAFLSKK